MLTVLTKLVAKTLVRYNEIYNKLTHIPGQAFPEPEIHLIYILLTIPRAVVDDSVCRQVYHSLLDNF